MRITHSHRPALTRRSTYPYTPTGGGTPGSTANDPRDKTGRSVLNDGLLPPIAHPGGALPSGGDPVNRFGSACSAYAADLNYDFSQGSGEIGGKPSAIGVYRSDAGTLATCPRGSSPVDLVHPECWPTQRLVAEAAPGHFLDKE
jgi:hypothetical protein